MKAWNDFKGGKWQNTIDVKDFIDQNYNEYLEDSSFLVGPTDASLKLNEHFPIKIRSFWVWRELIPQNLLKA